MCILAWDGVWQCDYFGSTLRQIALSMVQFAKAVYSENSLELSILVNTLDTIQTMRFILVFVHS